MMNEADFKDDQLTKNQILLSLKEMVSLLGKNVKTISSQIIALIQSSLATESTRKSSLECCEAFVFASQLEDFDHYFITIIALLHETILLCNKEELLMIKRILEYLIVTNKDKFQGYFTCIPLFPNDTLFEPINQILTEIECVEYTTVIERMLELTLHRSSAVVLMALRELKRIIQTCLYEIYSDLPRSHCGRVLAQLLRLIGQYNEENYLVQRVAAECLGMLGAIDPGRLDLKEIRLHKVFHYFDFSQENDQCRFSFTLIESYLVPCFVATPDTKLQGFMAYSIQELLKYSGLSQEGSVSSIAKRHWNALPYDIQQTILPMISSKYTVESGAKCNTEQPFYMHANTIVSWLQNWIADLARKMSEDLSNMFKIVQQASRELKTAIFILPHAILAVLCSEQEALVDEICREIKAVLNTPISAEDGGKIETAIQIIFDLMDFLNEWMRIYRQRKPKKTDDKRRRIYELVQRLVADIPEHLLSQCAMHCNAYVRAKMYTESYIRKLKESGDKDELQNQFKALQKIDFALGDFYSVIGISEYINKLDLMQEILKYKGAGDWSHVNILSKLLDKRGALTEQIKCLMAIRSYGNLFCIDQQILLYHKRV